MSLTWQSSREQWAEDHGYWHWICRDCGMSGWTDTQTDCACEQREETTEAGEES